MESALSWKTSPEVFEAIYYADANPDVARKYGKKIHEAAVKHYLNNGYKENRKGNGSSTEFALTQTLNFRRVQIFEFVFRLH